MSEQDEGYFEEEIKPTIKLLGDNPVTIDIHSTYEESGWIAYDAFGNDLTNSVEVSGEVDESSIGEYIITYSVTDKNGLTATATRKIFVQIDYFKIVKNALLYNIGNIEPVENMVDAYIYDKFLFVFPHNNKKNIDIYLYDERYDLHSNFKEAALKVYELKEWLIYGQWVDILNTYMINLSSLINEHKEILEEEKRERELEEEKKLDELIAKFARLFDIEFVDGFSDLQLVDINRLVGSDMLDEDERAIEFISRLYGIDIIEVPNLISKSY